MKKNAIALLLFYAGFTSCAKSTQQNAAQTKQDELSLSSWQYDFTDSVRFNGTGQATITRNSSKACDVAQTLTFNRDGSFAEEFACSTINTPPETGTWRLQMDALLAFNSSKPVKITKLTTDTLAYVKRTIYYEATQAPGVDGIDSVQVCEVYSH